MAGQKKSGFSDIVTPVVFLRVRNPIFYWKADGGFGIQAMMAGGVIRLDFAYSDEGV